MGICDYGSHRIFLVSAVDGGIPKAGRSSTMLCMELEYIRSDREKPTARVPWARLLGYRQTWAFLLAKFLTDPIWWFYLFWVPGFFQKQHGLNLAQIGLPIVVIYVISDAGSVAGGWLSSKFISRGYSANLGRKVAMLICAVCVVPIIYAYRAKESGRRRC